MILSRVAYPYASALFQTAKDKDELEVVIADVRLLLSAVTESDSLVQYLQSPIVKAADKKTKLTALFRDQVSNLAFNFLLLLIEKRREGILPETMAAFVELYNKHSGIQPVRVVSAVELNSVQKEQLLEKVRHYTGGKVDASYETDASLIGGFVVHIGDKMLDASIRHQLDLLRDQFKNGSQN